MSTWELKRVYVPFDTEHEIVGEQRGGMFSAAQAFAWLLPSKATGTDKAYQEADALSRDGWELVSVVPLTKAYMGYAIKPHTSYGTGGSLTVGLLLWFKRPTS